MVEKLPGSKWFQAVHLEQSRAEPSTIWQMITSSRRFLDADHGHSL